LAENQVCLVEVGGSGEERWELTLVVENVKLFCSECDSSEVFKPVFYRDLTNELAKGQRHSYREGPEVPLPDGFQLFAILLQCQRCTRKPEAVLVRREGWRLSLHGRSPMEHVDVPKFIPKKESYFFRDAIVAAHGGKTLAGLFYLRVFIEQFARRVIGETGIDASIFKSAAVDDMTEQHKSRQRSNRKLDLHGLVVKQFCRPSCEWFVPSMLQPHDHE
jgi:hypothetical protein